MASRPSSSGTTGEPLRATPTEEEKMAEPLQAIRTQKIGYCGRLSLEHRKNSGHTPAIHCIDWLKVPSNIGKSDVLGIVGSSGTQIYTRDIGSTRQFHQWKQVQNSRGCPGTYCEWHPRKAWLAVLLDKPSDPNMNQFMLVVYDKKISDFTIFEEMYKPMGSSEIVSFSWTSNYLVMALMDGILCIKYIKSADVPKKAEDFQRQRIHIRTSPPYSIAGYPSLFEDAFVVGGDTTEIQVFHAHNSYWERTFPSMADRFLKDSDTGHLSLAFRLDGECLAALCPNESCIKIWYYESHDTLILIQTISGIDPKSLTLYWTGGRTGILATVCKEMESFRVYVPKMSIQQRPTLAAFAGDKGFVIFFTMKFFPLIGSVYCGFTERDFVDEMSYYMRLDEVTGRGWGYNETQELKESFAYVQRKVQDKLEDFGGLINRLSQLTNDARPLSTRLQNIAITGLPLLSKLYLGEKVLNEDILSCVEMMISLALQDPW